MKQIESQKDGTDHRHSLVHGSLLKNLKAIGNAACVVESGRPAKHRKNETRLHVVGWIAFWPGCSLVHGCLSAHGYLSACGCLLARGVHWHVVAFWHKINKKQGAHWHVVAFWCVVPIGVWLPFGAWLLFLVCGCLSMHGCLSACGVHWCMVAFWCVVAFQHMVAFQRKINNRKRGCPLAHGCLLAQINKEVLSQEPMSVCDRAFRVAVAVEGASRED